MECIEIGLLILERRMPYKLRHVGTSEFVSAIDPHMPGEVMFVDGWNHPDAVVFLTETSAQRAMDKVYEIEGFRTTMEET